MAAICEKLPRFGRRSIYSLFILAMVLPLVTWGQSINWIIQFGSVLDDTARDVALFKDAVYVVGGTNDAAPLGNQTDSSDAYLNRFDRRGNLVWSRAFGDAQFNEAFTVFADDNGVYVGGSTVAEPADILNPDTLVAKYDHAGNLLWERQFGKSAPDWAADIAADDSGIYVVGDFIIGREAYLYKFDHDGNELWQDVFGEPRREQGFVYLTSAVATDGVGVYTTGIQPKPGIPQDATETDAFVRRYKTDGSLVWARIIDTNASTFARDMAIDESGIYVTGDVAGTLVGQISAGGTDSFVVKLDRNSTDVWARQFGTAGRDRPGAIDVDSGVSYVFGDLGTQAKGIWSFDDQGSESWRLPLDGSGVIIAEGIAISGGVGFIVGYANGGLGSNVNLGGLDAFLANFTTITVSVDDVTVSEADGQATVRVGLSEAAPGPVSVRIHTRADTAVGSSDYFGFTTDVFFATGETEQFVIVNLVNDTITEMEELFQLRLFDPTGVVIEKQLGDVTIIDDDSANGGGSPIVSVADLDVNEADGTGDVKVSLNEAATNPTSVKIHTRQSTAMPAQDYYGFTRTVNFAAGEIEQSVSLTILNDTTPEPVERLQMRLFAPNGLIIGDGLGDVTINDDDAVGGVPIVSIDDITINEGAGTVIVAANLSMPSSTDTSVSVFTRHRRRHQTRTTTVLAPRFISPQARRYRHSI